MISSKKSLNPHSSMLLSAAILITCFRLPIAALAGLHLYGRTLIALPFIILSMQFFSRKKVNLSIPFVITGCCLLWGAVLSVHLYTVNEVSLAQIISGLSSQFGVFAFLLALFSLNHSAEFGTRVLTQVTFWIVVLGSSFILFENLGYLFHMFSRQSFMGFLIPPEISKAFGGTYSVRMVEGGRSVGFLGNPSSSSALIAACTIHQLVHRKKDMNSFFLLLIGCAGVFLTGSLTSSIVLLVSTCIVLLSFSKSKRVHLIWLAFAIIAVEAIFHFSSASIRLNYYLRNIDLAIADLKPNFSDCWNFPVWGLYTNSKTCHFTEMHILSSSFKYGFLAMLPWNFLAISPILFFCLMIYHKALTWSTVSLCLVFLAGSAHYSAISAWGPNYLFALGCFCLWQETSKLSLQKLSLNARHSTK